MRRNVSMSQQQSTSGVYVTVSVSSSKKRFHNKPITYQDNEDEVQELAPDTKRHKSSGDDLTRIRTA